MLIKRRCLAELLRWDRIGATLASVGNRYVVPYLSLFDENGSPAAFYENYGKTVLDTVGKGGLLDWHHYPVEDFKHNTETNTIQEYIENIDVSIKLFSDGMFKANYQRQRQDALIDNHFTKDSCFVRNMVNAFSQINEVTRKVTTSYLMRIFYGKQAMTKNLVLLEVNLILIKR